MALLGLGIVAMLGGLFLLIVALFLYLRQRRFLDRAVETTGVVVGQNVSPSAEGGAVTRPVVRFRTEDGERIEFEDAFGSNPSPYRVGRGVPVLYDPERPGQARIRSFGSLWLFCLITGVIGTTATCCLGPFLFTLAAVLPAQ